MNQIREVRSIDTVGCRTDRYITVGREIRFISLFGSSTRVNTIKAIILKGEIVYLQDCWTGRNHLAVTRANRQLKAMTRQITYGVAHCLLYAPDYLAPEGEFAEKIFFGDSKEQILEKFYYVAQNRYSTPFMTAWAEWLLRQMEQTEEINALGFNQVLGIKFLEENDLEERLFEAGAPLSADDIAIAMNG